jgi:hypothetical protein
MQIKDYFQIIAWLVASIGGVIAAFKAIVEVQRNRKQREIELRWKQAQLAKEILDEIEDDSLIQNAKKLIDWHEREYEVRKDHIETITQEEVLNSLKKGAASLKSLSEKEKFIIECLEEFFMRFERLEHLIVINLIEFDDISDPLYWWVKSMNLNRSDYEKFLKKYEYGQAINFLNRFDKKFNLGSWNYERRIELN